MHTGSTKKLAYVSPQRLKTATRVAGITREALYKALRPGAKPRFDTIAKVTRALGCKLVVARSIGPPVVTWSIEAGPNLPESLLPALPLVIKQTYLAIPEINHHRGFVRSWPQAARIASPVSLCSFWRVSRSPSIFWYSLLRNPNRGARRPWPGLRKYRLQPGTPCRPGKSTGFYRLWNI